MEVLGSGTYGVVYLDQDSRTAIKTVRLVPGKYRQLIEPLLMGTLSHPYLTRHITAFVQDTYLCMVLELATCDLETWTQRSKEDPSYKLDEIKLRVWVWQLLQALSYLHNSGVIHGDIKPANILVFPDRVELTDLSLARLKGWTQKYLPCTYIFRAPEVWRGEPWDEKVDIWALGITLYKLVYDEIPVPYTDNPKWETSQECKDRYLDMFSRWDSARPKLTNSNVDRIIGKCLQLNRPSADELLKDPWFTGMEVRCPATPIDDRYLIDKLGSGVGYELARFIVKRLKSKAIDLDRWDEVLKALDSICFSLQ
jgi:serine/threonine protein kinase